MYQTAHFEETRIEVMQALMQAHPLATLVTLAADGLTANHIPMIFDATPAAGAPSGTLGTLRGHVARANPLWRDFSAEHGALAVFQGPQTYITPSWYKSKQQTGRVVPTWNYAVVHARGVLMVRDDPEWLLSFLNTLTDAHEGKRAQPWKVSDAPDDYVEQMLKQIVGIEIRVQALTGKWKLSQNKPEGDREGVATGLRTSAGEDAAAMAALVGQGLTR
jgi:transcriptional regulator